MGIWKKVLAFAGIATIGFGACGGVSSSWAASNAKAETSCAVETPAGLLGEARFELFGRDNMTKVFVEIEKIGEVAKVDLPGTGTWQDPVRSLGTFTVSLPPGTYTWWYGDVVDTRTFGRADHGSSTLTIGVCPAATTTTAAATTTTVQPTTTTAAIETTTTAAATDLGSTTTVPPKPDGPCHPYTGDPATCDSTSYPTTTAPATSSSQEPVPPVASSTPVTTVPVQTTEASSLNTLPATGSETSWGLGIGFGFLVAGGLATSAARRRFAR